ncbi:MFS transporter [Novosphingobium lindaniclasticum]|uniref:Major facilitator superfamily (MFS) profile domain-containing protein n=1 Tax=Novosphingobium lindaniclasticum LE124 TaxID=1096930 RepID=T0IX04_9SPHN|nr:MFS transporter [Novosphingobium lindaniclasticum]EQB16370.1 hypothetical protein L284_09645 [Novosphingobium lindaniclasticum LE124]
MSNAKIHRSGSSRLALPLLVITTAQLMLVLDDSIANIALPSIQNKLGVSQVNLPWVVNAYILAFGSLLLLGGRAGDLWGRLRIFRFGIVLFSVASLLVGMAPSGEWVIAARAVQGIGAATTAPNALALIATTFPEGKARNTAVAVYGAMSALGIVVGLLLGGVLTALLDWRWVFFINVPIGATILFLSCVLKEAERHSGNLDLMSAALGTCGLAALVFAITRGGEHGFGEATVLASFAGAAILIPAFLVRQARAARPLLPLHLLADRNRAGSYATILLLGFGPMSGLYILTLYMQHILRFTPLQTGLAWLPFGFGIVVAAVTTSKLASSVSTQRLTGAGVLIATEM